MDEQFDLLYDLIDTLGDETHKQALKQIERRFIRLKAANSTWLMSASGNRSFTINVSGERITMPATPTTPDPNHIEPGQPANPDLPPNHEPAQTPDEETRARGEEIAQNDGEVKADDDTDEAKTDSKSEEEMSAESPEREAGKENTDA